MSKRNSQKAVTKLKVRIIFVTTLVLFFLSPETLLAAEEFSSDYNIIYDISEEGVSRISQEVTLTNLTKEYYARKYTLTVNSLELENIVAEDELGKITPEVKKKEEVTEITIVFNDKIVGLNKKFKFKISYENPEIASKKGKVWEINIPKLAESNDINIYNIAVHIPKSFGPLSTIFPEPKQKSEDDNFEVFSFDKESILQAGASLSFGEWQLFSFHLKYHLKNPTNGPILTDVALPPDIKEEQKIYYSELNPEPLKIYLDEDGNYLAEYKLEANEQKSIEIRGFAKITFKARAFAKDKDVEEIPKELKDKYTINQKFWPADDEKIIKKAEELTQGKNSAYYKAVAIYNFVTSYLSYSSERVNKDLERFGALKALENKDQAVCMEYTDLFITLARAARIPAREVDGYAYTSNEKIRPTIGDVLHAWVQIYLPGEGWFQIDPTWGSTTKGIDFFNNFDTNHFVFAIKGLDSEWPYPAGAYKLSPDQTGDIDVRFATGEELTAIEKNNSEKFATEIFFSKINLSGLPLKGRVKITNPSQNTLFSGKAMVFAKNLEPEGVRKINIGTLPPFSSKEIPFSFKSSNFFRALDEEVQIFLAFKNFEEENIADEATKKVSLTPFYAIFPLSSYLVLGAAILLYAILWRLRVRRRDR